MDKYLYDAKTNMFYPSALKNEYKASGLWPADGRWVDEKTFTEFNNPPPGKMRVAGEDGNPAWSDIPPPSRDELIAVAEHQKAALLAEASAIIAPMADAQAGGYIDEADVPRLAEWQRYRYRLTKIDTSTAPDIKLPLKPEV